MSSPDPSPRLGATSWFDAWSELVGTLQRNPLRDLLPVLWQVAVSQSETLCVLAFIIAHLTEGSLITLVYPLTAFFYVVNNESVVMRRPAVVWT